MTPRPSAGPYLARAVSSMWKRPASSSHQTHGSRPWVWWDDDAGRFHMLLTARAKYGPAVGRAVLGACGQQHVEASGVVVPPDPRVAPGLLAGAVGQGLVPAGVCLEHHPVLGPRRQVR